MIRAKFYRVEGYYVKKGRKIFFRKDYCDLDESKALEKMYSEIGSKHRVKRSEIKGIKVRELKPDEIKDPVLKALHGSL